MKWLLALLLIAIHISANEDKTQEVSTAAPEPVEFHARGIQAFKGNSDLPFRLLYVYPTDSKEMGDDYFTFIMLESTSTGTRQYNNSLKQPLNYVEVNSTSHVTMRLYFNPGNRLVGSLQLEMHVGYIQNGNHTTEQLNFAKSSDALLCPKAGRYEFGSCHYRRNQSTFEEIVLPTDQWPEGAKNNELSTVGFMLLEGEKKTMVLGATFFAFYNTTVSL